mmetsp:Transcript_10108/g.24919  ORF Transcript_10108/g.24919 Transcript_10108/m.24919 type:complete len:254 (+) Transcript_10108:1271-2032(+)
MRNSDNLIILHSPGIVWIRFDTRVLGLEHFQYANTVVHTQGKRKVRPRNKGQEGRACHARSGAARGTPHPQHRVEAPPSSRVSNVVDASRKGVEVTLCRLHLPQTLALGHRYHSPRPHLHKGLPVSHLGPGDSLEGPLVRTLLRLEGTEHDAPLVARLDANTHPLAWGECDVAVEWQHAVALHLWSLGLKLPQPRQSPKLVGTPDLLPRPLIRLLARTPPLANHDTKVQGVAAREVATCADPGDGDAACALGG